MRFSWILITPFVLGLAAGCGPKEDAKTKAAAAPPPAEVSVITVAPRDTPVMFEYVGQTQSSRQVEIVARVNGFLDKQVFTEGSMVKAGQVMFKQDPRPFQAQLEAARGALGEQQARLKVARDNLARVRPLAAKNALSKKDLDDAIGQENAAAAAVETAKANVVQAQLNLDYTTIVTPVTGLSSFARQREGAYIGPSNSLLTYVEQVDPIWVNFSVSENDLLKVRTEGEKGQLRLPDKDRWEVQVELADGTTYGHKGVITFGDAGFNQQTGTYLLRATLPNPAGTLKPNQFVRVRVGGAIRPNAILVPQDAVLQGAKGQFVWVVDKESKAQVRPVQVASWNRNDWFVTSGLAAGDVVAVSGLLRLAAGAPVKVVETADKGGLTQASSAEPSGAGGSAAK